MNNKQRYDYYKKAGLTIQTEENRIKHLVDKLLDLLFIPSEGDCEFVPDWSRIEKMGIDPGESVNWIDLKCNEVKKIENGSYLVIIDEASPGDCQTLCEYIEKYMSIFGWSVRVETEW